MPAAVASVFAAAVMRSVAYMALSVAGFVCLKMVKLMRTAIGQWPVVAAVGIVAIVDVAIKTAMTVEPGSRADEYATREPVWPVVAVGCAAVRVVAVVAIGADGGCVYGCAIDRASDTNAN